MRRWISAATAFALGLPAPVAGYCGETAEQQFIRQLAMANAYDIICPEMTLTKSAREFAVFVLAKNGNDPATFDAFMRKTAEYALPLMARAAGQVCDEAKDKFGQTGTEQKNWLERGGTGGSLEEIVSALDRDPPDMTTRSVIDVMVMISQAEDRCPGVSPSDRFYTFVANARFKPRELDADGRFGPVIQTEKLRILAWMDRNADPRDKDWFCRQVIARFGPEGWQETNLIVTP